MARQTRPTVLILRSTTARGRLRYRYVQHHHQAVSVATTTMAGQSCCGGQHVVWRKTLGTNGVTPYSGADGDGDGTIDQDDYGVWRDHFGQTIPPPGTGSGVNIMPASAAQVAPVNGFPSEETSLSLNVGEPSQTVEPRKQATRSKPRVNSHKPSVCFHSCFVANHSLPASRSRVARGARRTLAASRCDEVRLPGWHRNPSTRSSLMT